MKEITVCPPRKKKHGDCRFLFAWPRWKEFQCVSYAKIKTLESHHSFLRGIKAWFHANFHSLRGEFRKSGLQFAEFVANLTAATYAWFAWNQAMIYRKSKNWVRLVLSRGVGRCYGGGLIRAICVEPRHDLSQKTVSKPTDDLRWIFVNAGVDLRECCAFYFVFACVLVSASFFAGL